MSSPSRSPMVFSQFFQQNQRRTSFDTIQIPSENQILLMFEKNGFRSNNIVTRDQLKELFDRQYVTNNLNEVDEGTEFSQELFDELWGHLELLSDSTTKIENIGKVIYDAMDQLQRKLKVINGPQGLKHKQKSLENLIQKEKELTDELDQVDAEFNYHQQKIKAQRNATNMNIGKLKSQISQIFIDKNSFENELQMLIVTIGEHAAPPIETKLITEGLMGMSGIQRKEKSDGLKLIFVVTIILIVLQMFTLSYKNSFLTLLGLCALLYVLFCGYYTDKSVLYLILYFILSILLDLTFVYMNMFTTFILSPIIFTLSSVLKYVGMICVLVSAVGRILLVAKLFGFKEIPKNLQYFQFWGEEVLLNRRNKQFAGSRFRN